MSSENPMVKDFGKWFERKNQIENKNRSGFFHEREVWWCSLGLNVGFEEDGKGEGYYRPILVFKKFNNEIFLAIPLTSQVKKNKYYIPISFGDLKTTRNSIILSQIRLIDSKRLGDKMGAIDEDSFQEIKKAFITLIG